MISRIPRVFTIKSMTNHHGCPRLPECQRASPFQKILHTTINNSMGPKTLIHNGAPC